jgi:hypothetical protein
MAKLQIETGQVKTPQPTVASAYPEGTLLINADTGRMALRTRNHIISFWNESSAQRVYANDLIYSRSTYLPAPANAKITIQP